MSTASKALERLAAAVESIALPGGSFASCNFMKGGDCNAICADMHNVLYVTRTQEQRHGNV